MTATDWVCFEPKPDAVMRLACFPYAGGGAAPYRRLLPFLPEGVELWSARPPGREVRFREPAFTAISSLADHCIDTMGPLLDRPLALLGHSMGAITAFEVAHRLEANGTRISHLTLSAHRAPHLPSRSTAVHLASDDAILARLTSYGGTPPGFFDDQSLVAALLPNLRRDFQAVETYVHEARSKLAAPATIHGGRDDATIDHSELGCWADSIERINRVEVHDGGHFYWLEDPRPFGMAVGADLRQFVEADI